jgi:hypothetical protein
MKQPDLYYYTPQMKPYFEIYQKLRKIDEDIAEKYRELVKEKFKGEK